MTLLRPSLSRSLPSHRPPLQYFSASHRPPLAFAFDIDGVLLRGSKVLPQARRALASLEGDNPFGRKIPRS
ncbi:hypothetical protein OF83DRAFT_1174885 [Amylostereum chailletii]|nr:hypothetical protein OF83DRAFT_1174885 [Amylostereum chailletii]